MNNVNTEKRNECRTTEMSSQGVGKEGLAFLEIAEDPYRHLGVRPEIRDRQPKEGERDLDRDITRCGPDSVISRGSVEGFDELTVVQPVSWPE